MRISFEWLKDFVDVTASAEEVADRLTMAGLEVEGTETIDGDTIFEVNVTPNRPDCLSIIGIAREVAAAFNLPLKIPQTDITENLPLSYIKVEILNHELCSRYTGRVIKNVRICDSPEWLKKRLEKCGIRSLNNNIVDVTNYVLLEMGHPLHAFDADKLYGSKIKIAVAGKARNITTLDSVERKLPEDSLLIWDERKPVAVAGIMGGEESGVTFETKNIFLESAYFAPFSIRRTSKELGLRSESSYRFERGTDIEFLENALNRASLLIRETGGGIIHEIVDAYPVKYVQQIVKVNYKRVNTILGTDLQKEKMAEMLAAIGISSENNSKEILNIYPPAFRRDISEFVDVAEEIARLYQYSNIPAKIPKSVLTGGVLNDKENNFRKIKEAIRKSGFNEVINYSFMNYSDADKLLLPGDDRRRNCFKIRNPLRPEDSLMRTTLIPALINNFLYNFARGINDIRFYELAKVYIGEGKQLPSEENRLGGIFYRENLPSLWKDDVKLFFIAKGALTAFFEEMKIKGHTFIPSEEVFLHKGKSADIILKDSKIGFIGELSPDITENLKLKIKKPEIIVFEINIDTIMLFIPENLKYCQIPKYPSVERDIAIILDEDMTYDEVMGHINSFKSEFIEKVELFDYYKGRNMPENKKSLAFRIIYRSNDRTLTELEVEAVHGLLVNHVLNKTSGELRSK